MNYCLTITPSIDVSQRHSLEDQLDEFLSEFEGCTSGGGGMLDGSGCDVDFECEKSGFEDPLKVWLQNHVNANVSIKLMDLDHANELFRLQCQQHRRWWQFWR